MSETYQDHLCAQLDEMLDVLARPMRLDDIVESIRCYPNGRRFTRASESAVFESLHHLQRIAKIWKIYAPGQPALWVSREALKYNRTCREYAEYQRRTGNV